MQAVDAPRFEPQVAAVLHGGGEFGRFEWLCTDLNQSGTRAGLFSVA